MSSKYTLLLFLIVTVVWKIGQCLETKTYSLLMPNVSPKVPELYLCTPVKVDSGKSYFIIGFQPNATMQTAHHMLIYGCSSPGSTKPLWNCGEMARDSVNDELTSASPCNGGSEIIYAWAMDAPRLDLPDKVGFKVGGDTMIQYLVLQVHYAHIEPFKDGSTDDSGVFLKYTTEVMPNQAGVYLLGTNGRILPKSIEKMESSCKLTENKTIYPFAYRVHTHSLGVVVSGYVIKPHNNKWIELGKKNPQKPQMFYPIHNKGPISQNDTLAARCTMKSNRDRITYIGATNKDEMCNFYLMYYVEGGEPLENKYCFTAGPPLYRWEADRLTNIPDKEASTLSRKFP